MKTLIVCCDNRGGMMFNKRRQSRDSKLNEKLLEMFGEENLYIAEYSRTLFPNCPIFQNYENDGAYFMENPDWIPVVEDVFEQIIVVKWNRDYPFDKKIPFSLKSYKMRKLIEFEGDSHDKISMEFYEKRGDI